MKQIYIVQFEKYPHLVKLGESADPENRLRSLAERYGMISNYIILASDKDEYDFFYHIVIEYYKQVEPYYKTNPGELTGDGNTEFYQIDFDTMCSLAKKIQKKYAKTDFNEINWLKFYINAMFKQLHNHSHNNQKKEDNKKLNSKGKQYQHILGDVGFIMRNIWQLLTPADPVVYRYIKENYYKWQTEALSLGWVFGVNNTWSKKTPFDYFDRLYQNPNAIIGSNYTGSAWIKQKTSIINGIDVWVKTKGQLYNWKNDYIVNNV